MKPINFFKIFLIFSLVVACQSRSLRNSGQYDRAQAKGYWLGALDTGCTFVNIKHTTFDDLMAASMSNHTVIELERLNKSNYRISWLSGGGGYAIRATDSPGCIEGLNTAKAFYAYLSARSLHIYIVTTLRGKEKKGDKKAAEHLAVYMNDRDNVKSVQDFFSKTLETPLSYTDAQKIVNRFDRIYNKGAEIPMEIQKLSFEQTIEGIKSLASEE